MPPNLPLLLLSLLLFSWRCGCELRVRVGPDNPASSLASSPAHSDNNNEEAEEDPLGADADVDAEEEANRDRERQRAVYSQVISGNSSTDTVAIEIETADGTIVSQLTDFRARSQILRVLIPGEEDLGQPNFQAFCFVSSYSGDLIPPEAVMKLRQKNPGTVRVADEDRGEVVQDSPLRVAREKFGTISTHLHSFCRDARDSVLSSEHELYNILESALDDDDDGGGVRVADVAKEAMKDSEHLPRCFAVEDRRHPCVCSLRVCLDWYPCALKYCRNRDGEGEHRCGIRTCRKCLTFRYPARARNLCMWDEV